MTNVFLNNEDKTITFNTQFKKYRETQLSKDLKLVVAVMVCVLLVLFHYVYIMKRLIDNPNMEWAEIGGLFALWLVNCCGSLYCLVYKVYPAIAGDSVHNKVDDAKKKQ